MTDLLKRLADLFRGRAHRVLDELEDPRELLELSLGDLNRQLSDLHASVARALSDEKRLRLEIRDHLGKARDWERRAVLALEDGDESLARQALEKREECEEHALALQEGWETQQQVSEKLKSSLKAAKRQVEETRRTSTLSVARYESAQARKNIADILTSQHGASPAELVEKLDDKIRLLEAETEVQTELGDGTSSLESRFRELENRRRGDEGLTALKALLEENKKLPTSSSRIDELKARLDES